MDGIRTSKVIRRVATGSGDAVEVNGTAAKRTATQYTGETFPSPPLRSDGARSAVSTRAGNQRARRPSCPKVQRVAIQQQPVQKLTTKKPV
jgi:hypothetical protein